MGPTDRPPIADRRWSTATIPGVSDRLLAVGADGARGGWLAALGFGRGEAIERLELRLVGDFDGLFALCAPGIPLAVDIPMGLADTVALRPCDRQARSLLGRRAATIFPPPSRVLLAARTYAQARELVAREREHRPAAHGLSAQAFGLAAKIREADALLQADAGARERVWECHPELSFRAMAGGRVPADKKSIAGQADRLALLQDRLPGVLDAMRGLAVGRRHAEPADALDALACLQTARRIRAGDHETLGGGTDALGIPMRIVF